MRRCATGMTVNNRNGTWPVVGNTFRTDNGLEILYCMGSIHSPNFFYTPIDLLFAIIYDGNAVTAKHLEYDARIIVWVRNKNAWYYLFWGKFSIEPSYIYLPVYKTFKLVWEGFIEVPASFCVAQVTERENYRLLMPIVCLLDIIWDRAEGWTYTYYKIISIFLFTCTYLPNLT